MDFQQLWVSGRQETSDCSSQPALDKLAARDPKNRTPDDASWPTEMGGQIEADFSLCLKGAAKLPKEWKLPCDRYYWAVDFRGLEHPTGSWPWSLHCLGRAKQGCFSSRSWQPVAGCQRWHTNPLAMALGPAAKLFTSPFPCCFWALTATHCKSWPRDSVFSWEPMPSLRFSLPMYQAGTNPQHIKGIMLLADQLWVTDHTYPNWQVKAETDETTICDILLQNAQMTMTDSVAVKTQALVFDLQKQNEWQWGAVKSTT